MSLQHRDVLVPKSAGNTEVTFIRLGGGRNRRSKWWLINQSIFCRDSMWIWAAFAGHTISVKMVLHCDHYFLSVFGVIFYYTYRTHKRLRKWDLIAKLDLWEFRCSDQGGLTGWITKPPYKIGFPYYLHFWRRLWFVNLSSATKKWLRKSPKGLSEPTQNWTIPINTIFDNDSVLKPNGLGFHGDRITPVNQNIIVGLYFDAVLDGFPLRPTIATTEHQTPHKMHLHN